MNRPHSNSLLFVLLCFAWLPLFDSDAQQGNTRILAVMDQDGAWQTAPFSQATGSSAAVSEMPPSLRLPPGTLGGKKSMRLKVSWTSDMKGRWFGENFAHPEPVLNPISEVGIWVKGDGSGTAISAILQDADFQRIDVQSSPIDFKGWKRMALKIAPRHRQPLKLLAVILSNRKGDGQPPPSDILVAAVDAVVDPSETLPRTGKVTPPAERTRVELPSLFGPNMVLQRNQANPIWGTARPGDAISIRFDDKEYKVTADAEGVWKQEIGPFPEGGPHTLAISGRGEDQRFENVMVGEVWLVSGQSNMAFALQAAATGAEAIRSSSNDQLRLFTVARRGAEYALDDPKGTWAISDPKSTPTFSAVGWFFGQELQKALGVPVGIICSAMGASRIEAWGDRPVLDTDPWIKEFLAKRDALAQGPKAIIPSDAETAGRLYNGMVHPLLPFGIRGVVWYQGESSAYDGYAYHHLLPAFINHWRDRWARPDLPFIVVQLPGYREPSTDPQSNSPWALTREAQLLTAQKLKNVGLVVTIDLGDAKDIHPTRKEEVGKRVALNALSGIYGKELVAGGPTLESAVPGGGEIVLTFQNIGTALTTLDGATPMGFAVAGTDKKWQWADATIEGGKVHVKAAGIADPKYVRYGWAENPGCNLANKEGLPASPFRTDPPEYTP